MKLALRAPVLQAGISPKAPDTQALTGAPGSALPEGAQAAVALIEAGPVIRTDLVLPQYEVPSAVRLRVLQELGHSPDVAKVIERIEARENTLLSMTMSMGLTPREEEELAHAQRVLQAFEDAARLLPEHLAPQIETEVPA